MARENDSENMKERKTADIFIRFLPIAVMIFIFIQSALPADLSLQESVPIARWLAHITGLQIDTASFIVRKCAHFLEYAVLGASLVPAAAKVLERRRGRDPFTSLLTAWIIGTAYAASDEFHQRFVPGRSGEIRDVLVDSAGALTGAVILYLILRRRKKRQMEERAIRSAEEEQG